MLSLDFSSTNTHMRLKIVLFPVPIYTAYTLSLCSLASFFCLKQLFVARFWVYSCNPLILCIIRSYFSSISHWWFDLVCIYNLLLCTASIGILSRFIWLFHSSLSIYRSLPLPLFLSLPLSLCHVRSLFIPKIQLIVRFGKGFRLNVLQQSNFDIHSLLLPSSLISIGSGKASVDTQNWQKWSKLLF